MARAFFGLQIPNGETDSVAKFLRLKFSYISVMEEEVEYSLTGLLWRYFAHGIAFSILLTLASVAWAFLLAMLMIVGWIIGLIIGFLILFIIIGGLNAFLTGSLWGIEIRDNWKTHLAHGFALFFVLLLVDLPVQLVFYAIPNIVTLVVVFVITVFANGYVAKAVALRVAGEEIYESTDYVPQDQHNNEMG